MLQQALTRVVAGSDLTAAEAEAALNEIMAGEAGEALLGGFLVALRMKGETADEIAGFARAMRANCVPVRPTMPDVVDIVGTGGDACDTLNISTAAAFVAAGAGVPIAKHGNRAVSSQCGSADVLTALGVNISLPPQGVAACIDEVGIGFLFAAALHPAMKHAAGARRQLAMRTVFNILGPLTNPAGARRQVIGVFDPAFALPMAEALCATGSEHVLIVHGAPGLDEISLCGPTRVAELRDGDITVYEITPEDLGLPACTPEDLAGGDPATSAQMLREVLAGAPGARRDVVLANAAAALVVAGRADTLAAGVATAREAVTSGAAAAKLRALQEFSNRFPAATP
jgi:anthranilate phosphoribosyltransferase